jgi:hypothetical protein
MRFAFMDLRFHVMDTGFDDGNAWIRLRMRGVHTGPFVRFANGRAAQVIPATSREIDFEQIHVLGLDGGRVTSHQAVRDDLTMLGQLGAFPPTPRLAAALVWSKVSGHMQKAVKSVIDITDAAAGQPTLSEAKPA